MNALHQPYSQVVTAQHARARHGLHRTTPPAIAGPPYGCGPPECTVKPPS